MDKEWMCNSRESETYVVGVDMFLNFAFRNVVTRWGEILCPCKDCVNGMFQSRIVCRDHLIIKGFMPNYTVWRVHGEALASSSVQNENDNEPGVASAGMHGMVNDIFVSRSGDQSVQVANFYKYMNDAGRPLYPECKTETKLSFVVWLFNLKCMSKWTDKSFNLLLGKLKQILPDGKTLPANLYETKKMIGDLGFSYEKIDACPNDCMLYWREDSKLDLCKVCNKSR
ncbi:hypothetical protein RJ639_040439 [Escallonia herrerae]|uniref:Transposase-associated domain-containing protein n=1 Tax=Escallonia herrerae TaxID=1293975 RepID=A0AA88WEN4_9ASTE|nr:hypothetical protein RJ639_040439 [Escallonia herrerae]